jgi:hypothetical protein
VYWLLVPELTGRKYGDKTKGFGHENKYFGNPKVNTFADYLQVSYRGVLI